MKTQYVVGFMFNKDFKKVALIRKNKPDWQAGLLNGVGGKVEPSDSTHWHAMVREFGEETGVTELTGWKPFHKMSGENNDRNEFSISFFYNSDWPLDDLKSPESEKIEIHLASDIAAGNQKTIGNLPWLVALAVDFGKGVHPPKWTTSEY